MTKEPLTPKQIQGDLMRVLDQQSYNTTDGRLSFIVPTTLGAILLGILLHRVWIALVILLFPAYHMIRLIGESRKDRQTEAQVRNALTRGDISISEEILSHIGEETIYEPHTSGRRTRTTRTVTFFYFEGGRQWRVPKVDQHYPWSRLYSMSSRGLDNTSVAGDRFYFITLQADHRVSYIYNTKLFSLKDFPTKKAE